MFSQQFELGFVIKVMIHFHRLLLSLTDFIADFAAPKSLIRHPKLQFNPTHSPTHHLRTNEHHLRTNLKHNLVWNYS